MIKFPRPFRCSAVLVTASVGLPATLPAGGPGIWSTCEPAPVCYECCEAEEPGLLESCDARAERWFDRVRKAPFDHYAHNPGDLRDRPICPPHCSPTAGYHEPHWRQLPDARGGFATVIPQSSVAYPSYSESYPPASPMVLPEPSPPPAPPSAPAEPEALLEPPASTGEYAPLDSLFPEEGNPAPSSVAPPAAFLPPYPPDAGRGMSPLAGSSTPVSGPRSRR